MILLGYLMMKSFLKNIMTCRCLISRYGRAGLGVSLCQSRMTVAVTEQLGAPEFSVKLRSRTFCHDLNNGLS